jgi:alpha-tubulin suppressor-like RCC1 family protein
MSLYVWGSNKCRQLNNVRELHSYAPTYIPSACGDNVPTAVAAGESHTLVLCESGDIYSFGRARDGQLGHSNGEGAEAKLVTGLGEETVVDIAAGSLTSYAVTSTGNVYQW